VSGPHGEEGERGGGSLDRPEGPAGNRSASYCLLEDFPRALADAEEVIKRRPDWAKGYGRTRAAAGLIDGCPNYRARQMVPTRALRARTIHPGEFPSREQLLGRRRLDLFLGC